jgi:hypothetical protein
MEQKFDRKANATQKKIAYEEHGTNQYVVPMFFLLREDAVDVFGKIRKSLHAQVVSSRKFNNE